MRIKKINASVDNEEPSKIRKENRGAPKSTPKENLKAIISSTPFSLFMSILTIYTIFAIDIDKGFFNKDASVYFSSIHLISMGIFTAEIIVMVQTDPDYLFHFYFWIDIFSTLTMLLEIIWIEDVMNSVENIQVAISFARVSKASRFSKIGARSTKIMKLIRLIKLIKFIRKDPCDNEIPQEIQPYVARLDGDEDQAPAIRDEFAQMDAEDHPEDRSSKDTPKNKSAHFLSLKNLPLEDPSRSELLIDEKILRPNVNIDQQIELQNKWNQLNNLNGHNDLDEQLEENEESTKVGEILKNEIQKNIVLMVMGVIIVVPILSADTWFTKTAEVPYLAANYLQIADQMQDVSQRDIWMKIFVYQSTLLTDPLVFMQEINYDFPEDFPPSFSEAVPQYDILRESEKSAAPLTNNNQIVFYSKKQTIRVTSWINMARSVFITFLLIFASIFFIKDLELYALGPLEKMSATLGHIKKNPYGWNNQDEEEQEEGQDNPEGELETMILEKLIIKMANLVSLGLGEAPSQLISEELEGQDSEESAPAKIKGALMCIKLAHQEQIHELLSQEDEIRYFNSLSQEIHEAIIENGGYLFEQDENSLLACWKMEGEVNDKELNLTQSAKSSIEEKKIADQCFYAFLKIMEKIYNSPLLRRFAYLSKTIDNFDRVKIHVGASFGLTSVGGLGSEFKLTMKTIGREATVSKVLSRKAQEYRVSNIFSHEIQKRSDLFKQFSRQVGEVYFSDDPKKTVIEMFGSEFDLLKKKIKDNKRISLFDSKDKTEASQLEIKKHMRKILKNRLQTNEKISTQKIEELNAWRLSNLGVQKMNGFQDWVENWKEGLEFLQDKQWSSAKSSFEICNDLYPYLSDTICNGYLQLIQQNKEEAPKNWKLAQQISAFF